jgi:L-threonylcarbamoyladenylate synthase
MKPTRQSTAKNRKNVIRVLRDEGGVGILPTDTLYGVVGSATRIATVRRIYRIRRRNPKKPMIILISDIKDLEKFNIKAPLNFKKVLNRVWPGRVSVILPVEPRGQKKLYYLHRGMNTLAFRMPRPKWLRDLLRETGPLVAPSANFEGEVPALTIRAARHYFGDNVDFYIDAGKLDSQPSTLITIKRGKLVVLRQGAVKLS